MKTPFNTKMPVGTEVVVRRDDGTGLRTFTRSAPWRLGHGAWVVAVEGFAGGYDLDRVTPITAAHARASGDDR